MVDLDSTKVSCGGSSVDEIPMLPEPEGTMLKNHLKQVSDRLREVLEEVVPVAFLFLLFFFVFFFLCVLVVSDLMSVRNSSSRATNELPSFFVFESISLKCECL